MDRRVWWNHHSFGIGIALSVTVLKPPEDSFKGSVQQGTSKGSGFNKPRSSLPPTSFVRLKWVVAYIIKAMRTEKSIPIFLAVFFLVACAESPTPFQTSTASSQPTLTLLPILPGISLTPPPGGPTGIQLPFNEQVVNSEYCQTQPDISLPAAEVPASNEDEITLQLLKLWLAYYQAPQAPRYCRIDGYHIDRVYYDERTPSLPLEPKGDFMRNVQFSIKLIQMPTDWMSWAGDLDQQNWLHLAGVIAVFHSQGVYKMEFANP